MLTITQIKQLMREYGFRPNKRLGQNFLIDRNIVDKIISAADFNKGDVALEIGAGAGNITAEVAGLVKRVIAVEFDKKLCEVIKATLSGYKNIDFVSEDILKVDLKDFAKEDKVRIIGNLPYYITTPILERIIENRSYVIDALLMVQKEVAERMLAKAGDDAYGSLSCYLSYYTNPKFKTVVKRASFFPQPEVDSALIYLKILDSPSVSVNDEALLFKIIRGAFNQRRKTLLTSLANKKVLGIDKVKVNETLKRAAISAKIRPEMLSLEDFARITNESAG